MIRISRFTVILKSGSKALLKELRNLSLNQTLSNLAEGLDLVEAGIKMSEDADRTSSEE
jgi:hypothetical protein